MTGFMASDISSELSALEGVSKVSLKVFSGVSLEVFSEVLFVLYSTDSQVSSPSLLIKGAAFIVTTEIA